MITKTALAALALTALALGGCGAGTSAAPPAPAAPSSAAESSAAPSPSTQAAAGVVDPCTVLDAAKIEDLSGVKVKEGTTQAVGASQVCGWYPEDGKAANAAVFSGQEGPVQASLSQIADQLKAQFAGKTSKLTVTGADEARYVTGTKSGLKIIDVVAQKDKVFYQVLVASPRDAAQHKDAAVKITELLLKG
jgi:hypothetical protein